VLADGRVLLAGGFYRNGKPSPAAQLYDPATDSWTRLPDMPDPRLSQTATLLPDGRVLVAGGTDGDRDFASVLLFDPRMGAWQAGPAMRTGRESASAALLGDGRVLVVGGFNRSTAGEQPGPVASAEMYDPARSAWVPAASPPSPGGGGRLLTLPDGSALFVGGFGESGAVAATYAYDARKDSWSRTGDLPLPMLAAAFGRVDAEHELVVGNALGPSNAGAAAVYSARTRRWAAVTPPPASSAFPLGFARVSRGRLLLVEVMTTSGRANIGGAIFDPKLGTWSAIDAYTESGNPGGFSMAALHGGRALVVTQAAHVFDPDVAPPPPAAGDVLSSTSLTVAEGVLAIALLLLLGVRALRSSTESS
jgi:hypothetical protein